MSLWRGKRGSRVPNGSKPIQKGIRVAQVKKKKQTLMHYVSAHTSCMGLIPSILAFKSSQMTRNSLIFHYEIIIWFKWVFI